jgi:hypothetical protein
MLSLSSLSPSVSIGSSFLILTTIPVITHAWEWSDLIFSSTSSSSNAENWLSESDISSMRVRDIKRRLARTYGYGADELARMIDKNELILALWEEEYRQQQKVQERVHRQLFFQGLWTTLVAVVVVMGWPLWKHVYEVVMVNWVVYTDRKLIEIGQCRQYSSVVASIGVFLMMVVDILQVWLTVSVLLSWVITSKYFFPMPTLAIRPAQFLGEQVAHGPLGRYGMNVAPMAVTWMLKFLRGRIENFTAKTLAKAYQQHQRNVRDTETEEERSARKAQRKAAKRAAKEEAAQREQQRWQQQTQFRKEMAEQATQQLFNRRQHAQHSQRQQQSPFPEDEEGNENNIDEDHGFLSDEDDAQDAKQQFEADLKHVDINDLD